MMGKYHEQRSRSAWWLIATVLAVCALSLAPGTSTADGRSRSRVELVSQTRNSNPAVTFRWNPLPVILPGIFAHRWLSCYHTTLAHTAFIVFRNAVIIKPDWLFTARNSMPSKDYSFS
ncbi:MAG: hypothetical protein SH819_03260 [Cytophagales bacterium]|nr:hypothetical protein [Cytophagales bacterium]